jgi:hypothetical protein
MSEYALIMQPHGNLGVDPPDQLWKYQEKRKGLPWEDPRDFERDANEIMQVFPKLIPIPVTAQPPGLAARSWSLKQLRHRLR